ncbi:L,D-transpeptidase [Paenibacillus sp. JTLBN-2024]
MHGTNEPDSVGKDESQGCIRMSRADAEELFDLVPMGTPVIISKGGLPDDLLAPQEKFRTKREQDQTNPVKHTTGCKSGVPNNQHDDQQNEKQ